MGNANRSGKEQRPELHRLSLTRGDGGEEYAEAGSSSPAAPARANPRTGGARADCARPAHGARMKGGRQEGLSSAELNATAARPLTPDRPASAVVESREKDPCEWRRSKHPTRPRMTERALCPCPGVARVLILICRFCQLSIVTEFPSTARSNAPTSRGARAIVSAPAAPDRPCARVTRGGPAGSVP